MTSFRIIEHRGYQDLFTSLRSGPPIGPIDVATPHPRGARGKTTELACGLYAE